MNMSIFARFFLIISTLYTYQAPVQKSAHLQADQGIELPPVVVKSIPENGARNFRGKKLLNYI